MDTATFRFYADLNYFLPPRLKQRAFSCPVYDGNQSVKHLIESLGIPHTEVDLILVGGTAVDFGHIVQPGDSISVYPPFRTLKPDTTIELRPPLPDPVTFLLDNHLGRLARYLRLLGFDALYFNNQLNDEELANLSYQTKRVLLTRDRGLLKRSQVVYGYCLRSTDTYEQLKSVILRYGLAGKIDPWKRCLRCNGILRPVEKRAVFDRLEPKTKIYFDEFQQCQSCRQVYWRGSHHIHLSQLLERIRNEFHLST